jgi:hypothetical protein
MRSTRGLAFAALAILAASSSENPTDPMPAAEPGPETWAPSMSVVSGVPSVCGAPTAVNLMLGPNIQSGSVEVANDEANLYVTFRSESWRPILATAVFVGDSPDDKLRARFRVLAPSYGTELPSTPRSHARSAV